MFKHKVLSFRSVILVASFLGAIAFTIAIVVAKPQLREVQVHGSLDLSTFRIDSLVQNRALAIEGLVQGEDPVQLTDAPWDFSKPVAFRDWHIRVTDVVYKNLQEPIVPGDVITIRTLGGTVGDQDLSFPDDPKLKVGDRVVLFLYSEEQDVITGGIGTPHFLAFNSGTFKINSNGIAHRPGSPPNTPSTLPITDLKSLVAQEVAKGERAR